jgi:hypothetical protein
MNSLRQLCVLLVLTAAACTTTLPGTPIAIDTVAVQFPFSCGGVGIAPFRIERDAETLRYVDVASGNVRRLVWPSGLAARLVDGAAILYASNGSVVARENEVIDNAGGCPREDGSVLVDQLGDRVLR